MYRQAGKLSLIILGTQSKFFRTFPLYSYEYFPPPLTHRYPFPPPFTYTHERFPSSTYTQVSFPSSACQVHTHKHIRALLLVRFWFAESGSIFFTLIIGRDVQAKCMTLTCNLGLVRVTRQGSPRLALTHWDVIHCELPPLVKRTHLELRLCVHLC